MSNGGGLAWLTNSHVSGPDIDIREMMYGPRRFTLLGVVLLPCCIWTAERLLDVPITILGSGQKRPTDGRRCVEQETGLSSFTSKLWWF